MGQAINPIGFFMLDLANLKEFAEKVAGEWNGDESGTLEDMATLALEIAEDSAKLQKKLEELDNYDYHS